MLSMGRLWGRLSGSHRRYTSQDGLHIRSTDDDGLIAVEVAVVCHGDLCRVEHIAGSDREWRKRYVYV